MVCVGVDVVGVDGLTGLEGLAAEGAVGCVRYHGQALFAVGACAAVALVGGVAVPDDHGLPLRRALRSAAGSSQVTLIVPMRMVELTTVPH